jgi:hypothetical protein
MKKNHYTFASATLHKVAMISLFVIFAGTNTFAQTAHTIRGVVTSADDKQPVPGANIYLKSLSSVGTFSDANGEFEFPRSLKPGEVLVFSFIGLETTEYVVPEQAQGLVAISMQFDALQMVDDILTEDEPLSKSVSHKRSRKGRLNR